MSPIAKSVLMAVVSLGTSASLANAACYSKTNDSVIAATTTAIDAAKAIIQSPNANVEAVIEQWSTPMLIVRYSLDNAAATSSAARWLFLLQACDIFRTVFPKFPEVGKIEVNGTLEFTDQRGNKSRQIAIRVLFTRENAATVKWENVARADADNIFRIADAKSAHPAFWRP